MNESSQAGASVLVLDDTEANLDVMVETLSDDYHVSVAMEGEAALEIATESPPDLILLDVSVRRTPPSASRIGMKRSVPEASDGHGASIEGRVV